MVRRTAVTIPLVFIHFYHIDGCISHMIHKGILIGVHAMDQTFQGDSLEKYKSYIQRRRVSSSPQDNDTSPGENKRDPANPSRSLSYLNKAENSDHAEASFSDSYSKAYNPFSDFGRSTGSDINGNNGTEKDKGENEGSFDKTNKYSQRRTDSDLYRRLHGQNRKLTRSPSYSSSYHGYGQSGNAEIEDNRTTVLAVKIIKQSLVCFALLGIIVLMQQRSEMAGILDFIKKQVIDANIDTNSILSSVENMVKECSRFLGGSP